MQHGAPGQEPRRAHWWLGWVAHFLFISAAIAGATAVAFTLFRHAQAPLITGVTWHGDTALITTTLPARTRLYADRIPLAEATTSPDHLVAELHATRVALQHAAVSATTDDGVSDEVTTLWNGPMTMPARGSRYLSLVLGPRRSAAAATITLPRDDVRAHALLALGWTTSGFIADTLDVWLRPSPDATSYYRLPFSTDAPAWNPTWETTYRGGDLTVQHGNIENTVQWSFPASDTVELLLHGFRSGLRFKTEIVEIKFDGYTPYRFDPLPETITTDHRYIWRFDEKSSAEKIVIGIHHSRASALESMREIGDARPAGVWERIGLRGLANLWMALPIIVLPLLCRRSFSALGPARSILTGSLLALTLSPVVIDILRETARYVQPLVVLRLFAVPAAVILALSVAAGVVASRRAGDAGIAKTVVLGCVAFLVTSALILGAAQIARYIDTQFYALSVANDILRSKIYWRDVGSALAIATAGVLVWWIVRPHQWVHAALRRAFPALSEGKSAWLATLLEAIVLIVLIWPFSRETFLHAPEPTPPYAEAANSVMSLVYPLANSAPLLFGLIFLCTGGLCGDEDAAVRHRRTIAAALFALFVVGTTSTILALPISATIAFVLAWLVLVPDDEWQRIDAMRREVVLKREHYIGRALDLREADRAEASLESLNQKFGSGDLAPEDYEKRTEALRDRFSALRSGTGRREAELVEQLAFGAGVAPDDLGNGRHAALVGFWVSIAFVVVVAQEALTLGTRSAAPVLTFVVAMFIFVGRKTLEAFALGYLFAHLRGTSGVTKATIFAALQVAALLPTWMIYGATSTIPTDVLVIVAFDVVVGFLAFDLSSLKLIRPGLLTPRRIVAMAGLQDVTVIFALFSGSIASILTGQLSSLALTAVKAAFPHLPVQSQHGP